MRTRLNVALDAGPQAETVARPCNHCQYCEFATVCDQQWRRDDSLFYVAGIRGPEIDALKAAGIGTLTELSHLNHESDVVTGVRTERLKRLSQQARLQRVAPDQDDLPFAIAESEDDETRWGLGLERLPQPDPSDLFIDFAVYGKLEDRPGVWYSELLEQKTRELGGIKTLISRNHYDEATFWSIYDRPGYQAVKQRTDPDNLLRDLYQKFAPGARR